MDHKFQQLLNLDPMCVVVVVAVLQQEVIYKAIEYVLVFPQHAKELRYGIGRIFSIVSEL